jgi:hypothetical protein
MKPMIGPAGVASPGRLAFLAAGLVVCGAWAVGGTGPGARPQQGPTPPPPFALRADLTPPQKAQLVTHFNSDIHVDVGPGADHRRLLKGPANAPVVGPDAMLAPELGAGLLDPSWTWADTGRVLARITLTGEHYSKLHLQTGVTYVCAKRTSYKNAWGNMWALLYGVAGGTVTYVDSLPLKVKDTRGPARFIVGADDDNFCFPCDSKWCCTQQQ